MNLLNLVYGNNHINFIIKRITGFSGTLSDKGWGHIERAICRAWDDLLVHLCGFQKR